MKQHSSIRIDVDQIKIWARNITVSELNEFIEEEPELHPPSGQTGADFLAWFKDGEVRPSQAFERLFVLESMLVGFSTTEGRVQRFPEIAKIVALMYLSIERVVGSATSMREFAEHLLSAGCRR